MAITDEIQRNNPQCFKRVKIKRRLVIPVGSSYYESDWQNVSSTVLEIDPITNNEDSLELNNFTQGGFGLTCKNDNFEWASEAFSQSHFFGYLTRHKTKIKIEAGYIASDGTEYSYDIGAGLIIGDEINAQTDGTIYIPCIAPGTLFSEAPADDVNDGTLPGGDIDWYDEEVVSSVVGYLYNLEINGVGVFTPFLEGSSITPANDIIADLYDFHDWSCAEALNKMAEVSNSVWYVGADFKLYFKSKSATIASQFTFKGPGETRKDINVYRASDYNEGLRNLYNRIAWAGTDPRVQAEESYTPGDESSSWKYGVRQYIIDNRLVTTNATRQTICDNLLTAYKDPKEGITIEVKFVPQLGIGDRVTLTYRGAPSISPAYYWNQAYFDQAYWASRRGGIKVNKDYKITRITHDVMTFKSILTLKEI